MKKAFRFGAIATLIAMALSSCNTEELMNLQPAIKARTAISTMAKGVVIGRLQSIQKATLEMQEVSILIQTECLAAATIAILAAPSVLYVINR